MFTLSLRVAGLAAASLPLTSLAQPVDKGGLPCVAEICIGDGLEELKRINWQPALSPRGSRAKPLPVRDRRMETADFSHINRIYRGIPHAAGPWLADRAFDRVGLLAIASVKAACAENHLVGTFVSPDGNPTDVMIKRLPDPTNGQRWTVFKISREITGAVTPAQRAQAKAALRERYAAFDWERRPRPEGSKRAMLQFVEMTKWGFSLAMPTDPTLEVQLRSQPVCGGSGSLPARIN